MHSSGLLCGVPAAVTSVRRSGVGMKRARAHPSSQGSLLICRCSSSPPASNPISDINSSAPKKVTSSESTLETVASSIENANSEVQSQALVDDEEADTGQPGVNINPEADAEQQEVVSEVEAGSQRTRSLDQQERITAEENVLSVGFGNNVLLLDKSKVIALGQKVAAVFLGITFSIAVFRTLKKFSSPKAKRKRTVGKNRELVEELMKYLPGNRETLTAQAIWVLRLKTGFSSTEIFRKYLWFLLRERAFDQEAVDDLVHLKTVLGMGDEEVAAGLTERAQRIYDKYGGLMLNTDGMSSSGIERKATCKALFGKMLYLADYEPLLHVESGSEDTVNLREIFGATESDIEKLRIISLQDVDMDKLDHMASADEESDVSDVE